MPAEATPKTLPAGAARAAASAAGLSLVGRSDTSPQATEDEASAAATVPSDLAPLTPPLPPAGRTFGTATPPGLLLDLPLEADAAPDLGGFPPSTSSRPTSSAPMVSVRLRSGGHLALPLGEARPATRSATRSPSTPSAVTALGAPRPVPRRAPRSRGARSRFAWPTPPLAHYPLALPMTAPEPCEIEGLGGNLISGQLVELDALEGVIQLQMAADDAPMPVRLSQLRRISLETPLLPVADGEMVDPPEPSPSAPGPLYTTPGQLLADRELGGALLAQAERLPYEIELGGGTVLRGVTLGCVETDLGLFLFSPLDDGGALRRSFYPRSGWEHYRLGERIGTLLVEHQGVSEEAVESAAREQQVLRAQRLGDVLLARRIVTAEQLLAALDQQARMPMVRLGEALMAMGSISEAQLQEALQLQQQERSLSLGEIMLRRKLVDPVDLQTALARKMGYPLVDLTHFAPDESALRLLDVAAAMRLRALPLMKRGGRLVVALQDPGRRGQIEELQALTHCPIAPALANEIELLPAIASAYRRLDPARSDQVMKALRDAQAAQASPPPPAAATVPAVRSAAAAVDRGSGTAGETGRPTPAEEAAAGPAEASVKDPGPPSTLLPLDGDHLPPLTPAPVPASPARSRGARPAASPEAGPAVAELPRGERGEGMVHTTLAQLVLDGLQRHALTLHIEVRPGQEAVQIKLRTEDHLSLHSELPLAWRGPLVARLKALAELDVTETRKPQQGRLPLSRLLPAARLPREWRDHAGQSLRLLTLPTLDGLEDLVLHLPSRARLLELDQIGLASSELDLMQGLLDQPAGLLLVTGLPRSGRSTTLQAMARGLMAPERRIWSLEEKVRLLQPEIRQSEFDPRQPGAAEAALAALRDADVDVVLVDELREAGAARVALELALSGRLVVAALPARGAYDAVSRLVEQGLPAHDLADGLLAVHHQRLVKRLCSQCRMSRSAKDGEVDDWLAGVLAGQFADDPLRYEQARAALRAEWVDRYGREGRLRRYQSPGCEHCQHSGWRHRIALHELTLNHRDLRRLIRASAPPWHFERLAQHRAEAEGHRSLRQDAVEKMLAGLIGEEQLREAG